MKFTEDQLKQFALPLSDSENERCLHAIKAIRDALKNLGYHTDSDEVIPLERDTYSYSVKLRKYYSNEEIEIFIQGSYANNTCVRGESDVDIAAVRRDIYEYAWGNSFNPNTRGFKHIMEAAEYKNAVEKALKEHFSFYSVHRNNKSIKVDGNTYRKQSDVVPAFGIHHYYNSDKDDYLNYNEGITIYADDGTIVNNFPKQHIANGRYKNVATNHYYKKMVRIAKKIRYVMVNLGYPGAKSVSSFGIESLLWNVPDSIYKKYSIYRFAFDEVVNYLYNNKTYLCIFREANGIKYLCPNALEIQRYSQFIDELHRFYDYDI